MYGLQARHLRQRPLSVSSVHTGDVEVIYRAVQGAHVGVVTVHPADNHYVFIHGPENP